MGWERCERSCGDEKKQNKKQIQRLTDKPPSGKREIKSEYGLITVEDLCNRKSSISTLPQRRGPDEQVPFSQPPFNS